MTNQTFPVIYDAKRIMVDPSQLYDSSQKFRDLINERGDDLSNICLRINYDGFSIRNVSNFLKICENQQTDVQNNELGEICLIAKMFQADKIYETGVEFIKTNIDSNFSISSNEFMELNGNKYMIIEEDKDEENNLSKEEEEQPIQFNHPDLNELEFDESLDQIKSTNDDNKDNNKNETVKTKKHSIFYEIKVDNQLMKKTKFYLMKDGKVLYMAKQKNNEIYIGEGKNFHISENKVANSVRITREKEFNIVNTDDQEFKIRFVKYFDKYSLNLSFAHKGSHFVWRPRQPKSLQSYGGEFKHKPIPSKKNIILQNARNHPTYILRKMAKNLFECECHPVVNPIIAFSIAISQITGPTSM